MMWFPERAHRPRAGVGALQKALSRLYVYNGVSAALRSSAQPFSSVN